MRRTYRATAGFPAAVFRAVISALAIIAAAPAAKAESVTPFARSQAIKWQGTVIDVQPLMDYYKRQFFKGSWTARQGLTPRGAELVKQFSTAASDGLEPADYLAGVPANVNQLSGEQLAAVELYLSDATIRYARDLYAGRTTPAVSEPDIVIARKQLDHVALLGSIAKNGAAAVTDRLRPQHAQYHALRKLLAGAKDAATRQKIIVNMERWRWLPRDLGSRHIMVNAADFSMTTVDGGKAIDRRKVIVGQPFHKTPMFSDNIGYSEFNPTWTISRNIAGNEILPQLRKDPGYLAKRGYVIYASWEPDAPAMNAAQIDWASVSPNNFPYRIVQPAGPENVLGEVKFLFPNKFHVYLHDTSSRNLFANTDRALSHGCIRVDKAMEYAQLLYNLDRNPAASQLPAIVGSKRTTQVKFLKPIPVHLTYFTLWVNGDGSLSGHKDIYGRDKLVGNILFGRV